MLEREYDCGDTCAVKGWVRIFCWLVIGLACVPACRGEWTYVGDMIDYHVDGNVVEFVCTNATVTVQVCADDIFRIRMSPSGRFKGNEPWVVIQYDWPACAFTVAERADSIDVSTDRITVRVQRAPLRLSMYDRVGKLINEDARTGAMGWDGPKVVCRKRLTATDHFFGLGQHYDISDLRGRTMTLWLTELSIPNPFFMGTDGYGIFFHNFWKTTFDFSGDPYQFSSPGGDELDYYWMYGPSLKRLLDLFTTITGKSPIPAKWIFGVLTHALGSTRPDQRVGQQGVLDYVRAAREVHDWPLDSVKPHSKGCGQNFWASPSTNWPNAGWGSFPAVDEMVQQLHDMGCHVLWWESPGIMPDCQMYQEGVDNGYFIMQKGKVWKGSFGSGLKGALIDFCNPAARDWLSTYVDFMPGFGSDGTCNDHGEEVKGDMYSPYENPYNGTLTGPEYHNLYAMLYDVAFWEAYHRRAPNKRTVHRGRSGGPGCQRYPIRGGQDSDEVGKPIHGEMMGAINLGLSGIPFKTFADRYSRKPQFPHPVRAAQYTFLGAAGQRSGKLWSDRPVPDDNYRFYGRLRYRLMPYIYTYAREVAQTGCPLVRALVLDYQDDPNTYDVYGQYLLGSELLIAPFWRDDNLTREVYLPEGQWVDFWDHRIVYEGRQTITYQAETVNQVPIFVKAGAILPLAPDGQLYVDQKTTPYTISVYPAGSSSFELYEDDGTTYDYERGASALTRFVCDETEAGIALGKSAPRGGYTIPPRDHVFRVNKAMRVTSVTLNGQPVRPFTKKPELASAPQGWWYDRDNEIVWVKVQGGADESLAMFVAGQIEGGSLAGPSPDPGAGPAGAAREAPAAGQTMPDQERFVSVSAYRPSPADGSVVSDRIPSLTWSSPGGTLAHDVYFGTDRAVVARADADAEGVYVRRQQGNSVSSDDYFPEGFLELGKTYYWRIDEFDGQRLNRGPVWSFTVGPPAR